MKLKRIWVFVAALFIAHLDGIFTEGRVIRGDSLLKYKVSNAKNFNSGNAGCTRAKCAYECPVRRPEPYFSADLREWPLRPNDCLTEIVRHTSYFFTEKSVCPSTSSNCDRNLKIPGAENIHSFTLSLTIENFICKGFNHSLLIEGEIYKLEIRCDSKDKCPIITLHESEGTRCYVHQRDDNSTIQISIIYKKGDYGDVRLYVNGMPLRQSGSCVSRKVHVGNRYRIRYSGEIEASVKEGSGRPGAVSITTFDVFNKILNKSEIENEKSFSQLVKRGVPYPECLCSGEGINDEGDCKDGKSRFMQPSSAFFLPPRALYDGVINSYLHYGFLPVKKQKEVILTLEYPSELTKIEIYTQRLALTVFKKVIQDGNPHWVHIFCSANLSTSAVQNTVCRNSDYEEKISWQRVRRQTMFKMTWSPGRLDDIVIVKSLRMVVHGIAESLSINGTRFLDSVPIYEIILYGTTLEGDHTKNECQCFPGNSYAEKCDLCGQCKCRSGNMSKSGRQCKPYISDLIPSYGPLSGGSILTFFGGLLFPEVKQDYYDTQVAIAGLPLCTNITRTDTRIQCVLEPLRSSLVHTNAKISIRTLVGDAYYEIENNIRFEYRPNPVVTNITPYYSFLGGGQNITVLGQHLDSVHLTKQNGMDVKTISYKLHVPCTVQNATSMVCTMPKFDTTELIHVCIGINFDGFEKYKNITKALPHLGTFKIFPTPQLFISSSFEYNEEEALVSLKGKNLNFACVQQELIVDIGNHECLVKTLDSSTLLCHSPSLGSWLERDVPFNVVVKLCNHVFREQVRWRGHESNSKTVLALIVSLVGLTLIFLLVFCLLRRKYRRGGNGFKPHRSRVRPRAKIIPEDTPAADKDPLLDLLNPEMRKMVERLCITRKTLFVKEKIGEGKFGEVYRGIVITKSQVMIVALKTLKANKDGIDAGLLSQFVSEATLMREFDHENVLTLLGIAIQDGRLFVILPYMEKGDLRTFVKDKEFDLAKFMGFVRDVVKGMCYLADRNFIHRDLAARNCMVSDTEAVRVGDFGLARDLHEQDYYMPMDKSKPGPLPYKWMAPESLHHKNFSSMSDIWSFGVLAWEIFSKGQRPYPLQEPHALYKFLLKGNRLIKPDRCPASMYSLMADCWHITPEQRPTFKKILASLPDVSVMIKEIQERPYVDRTPPLSSCANRSSSGTICSLLGKGASSSEAHADEEDNAFSDEEMADKGQGDLASSHHNSSVSSLGTDYFNPIDPAEKFKGQKQGAEVQNSEPVPSTSADRTMEDEEQNFDVLEIDET